MTTRKLLKQSALLVLLLAFGAMKLMAATIHVTAPITSNTTWTNNNRYILTGIIYVKNNATLTIDPGTIILGDSTTLGSLVITRGAKINAVGTPCQPIVFTSQKPAGNRKRGDWGGLIMLGYAEVNWPGDTGHVEGIVPVPETLYGGGKNPNCGNGNCPNNSDNSGTLRYVRIEFAGIALSPNNEINGLTMGGVGSGTTIDHVQVSYSNDDSYEWFGGNVNCKYLIAYNGLDDDYDTDNGYSGKIQFLVGMRDPNVADISGSKSFESDNDPTGSSNTPLTSVKFANATALGGASLTINPLFKQSIHTRRNTNIRIFNSIAMGMPQGILIDGTATIANYAAVAEVQNTYIQQTGGSYFGFTPSGDPNEAAATFNLNTSGNVFSTQYNGVLANPDFPLTNPNNLLPVGGNPLPAANNALYGGDPFFTNTTYVGAFNPAGDNWAGDWTNFDPQNAIYATKVSLAPIVAGSVTNVICPNSGAVNITVSGGLPPYKYVWSNGATTEDISGVAAGSYTVTVFDGGNNCAAAPKTFTIKTTKPALTSCTSTSNSITVFRSGNVAGSVTNYQLRNKKHSVNTWGPWITVGLGTSYTTTGLLSNTQYDFQLRGVCTAGNTAASKTLTCSTTAFKLESESDEPSVNAYPNPTSGAITVSLNGFNPASSVIVDVVNMLGQVVYHIASVPADDSSSLELNLNNVPAGVYHLKASDGVTSATSNIVVNR
jgi:hypothetical protein